jgi:hypothetical protein
MGSIELDFGDQITADNPVDIWLCGLAASANDLLTAMKSYDHLHKTKPTDADDEGRVIGERVYFFRLSGAHAHEALSYIALKFHPKEFLAKESSKEPIRRFVNSLSEASRDRYGRLLCFIEPIDSFDELFLSQIRHSTFHYLPNILQRAIRLKAGQKEKSCIRIGEEGLLKDIRYEFADEVMVQAMEVKIRQKHDSLDTKMPEDWQNHIAKSIIEIQSLLLNFTVDCIEAHFDIETD